MIANAPWAARYGHTSVIDAAGAIYVIGGYNSTTLYNDVWACTDKGVSPRGTRGVLEGYSRGTYGCSRVPKGYSMGTPSVVSGDSSQGGTLLRAFKGCSAYKLMMLQYM